MSTVRIVQRWRLAKHKSLSRRSHDNSSAIPQQVGPPVRPQCAAHKLPLHSRTQSAQLPVVARRDERCLSC